MKSITKKLLRGIANVSEGIVDFTDPNEIDKCFFWSYLPPMPASMLAETAAGDTAADKP